MPMTEVSRGPGIPFPPPFVYVAAYAIAALLNTRLEFLIDGQGAGTTQSVIGAALIGAGLVWMAYGIVRVGMGLLGYGGNEWFPRRPARPS